MIIIFIIIFFISIASIAYTGLTLSPRVGTPYYNIVNNSLEYNIPISLDNKGIFPIDILTTVYFMNSSTVSNISLPPGFSGTIPLKLSINFSNINISHININRAEIPVDVLLTIYFKPLLKISLLTNFSFNLGSPFENFRLYEPKYELYNNTHIMITIPFSFYNRSPINIIGPFSISVFYEREKIGFGETFLNVNPYSSYYGSLNLYLKSPWLENPELLMHSFSRNYTLVLSLPIIGNIERVETIKWDPLISNLSISSPYIMAYNNTHSRIFIPIYFENKGVIRITGNISGKILDINNNTIGILDKVYVSISPNQIFSMNMTGYIENRPVDMIKLLLRFETPYGILEGILIAK